MPDISQLHDDLEALDRTLEELESELGELFAAFKAAPLALDVEAHERALLEQLEALLLRRRDVMTRIERLTRVRHLTRRRRPTSRPIEIHTPPPPPRPRETPTHVVVRSQPSSSSDSSSLEGVGSSSPHVQELLNAAARAQQASQALTTLIEENAVPEVIPATDSLVWRMEERGRVQALVDEGLEHLVELEPFLQIKFCEMVQARIRALQRLTPHDQELKGLHFKMRRFLETERPGFAHGFAFDHAPQHGVTWYDDARYLEQHLRQALAPPTDAESSAAPTPPSSASNQDTLPEEADDDDERSPVVDPSWPWFAHTEGQRAVIYGGSPRPVVCDRYQETFRFAKVAWLEESDASSERLASWIQSGRVDFVIITRFCKHKHTLKITDAAKDAMIPCLRLPHGYGAGAFKAMIETNLGSIDTDGGA